jgi:hypothetical protein
VEWQVAGFGPLNGAGTSDMVLRDTQTGAFEVYDITHNQLTGAASLGQVGLKWQVGGFAPDPLMISARYRASLSPAVTISTAVSQAGDWAAQL